MNASKEEATRALIAVEDCIWWLDEKRCASCGRDVTCTNCGSLFSVGFNIQQVRDFLIAAHRKLPSEKRKRRKAPMKHHRRASLHSASVVGEKS